ncbi:hypothetical protein KPG71_18910 [Roseovarius sp. PS-C2]|uniref:hypothetical protein n=1 Tax=Roseovarius sp. PS-C2 TaxID=2820814 RepID=UPI001C0E535C|nr:hypothetical protein [Roseovarius sp. PS-C2]MBU3262097.1 hypothetical protein [Roseovarius sp. PS-C2]
MNNPANITHGPDLGPPGLSEARSRLASPADHTDLELFEAAGVVLALSDDQAARADARKWIEALTRKESA